METLSVESYIVRVNRENVDPLNARVSIFDHGFLFGDSIYEVVRTIKGKPLAWDRHMRRLENSAAGTAMELPWSSDDLLTEVMTVLGQASWEGDSYFRMIVTRGTGKIDLMPTTCTGPNLILIAKPVPILPERVYTKGEFVCVTDVIRNSARAMDPAIKSGNYLNNVIAMIEAQKRGAEDALMLNEHGNLTECTTSNFYLVKDGVIRTPDLSCGLLAGITREILLEIAPPAGIPVEEAILTVSDITEADEAFMSGTIRGVVPIFRVTGDVEWTAPPGPVTSKLREVYEKHVGLSD